MTYFVLVTSLSAAFTVTTADNNITAVAINKNFTAVPVDGFWAAEGTDVKTFDRQNFSSTSTQTGISACNDDNYCWGFNYCQSSPFGGDVYLKGVWGNSSCTAYFSNYKLPRDYKEISNANFQFLDTHHYQLPATICGQTCLADSTCWAFSVCGDDCYMKKLDTPKDTCYTYIK